MLKDNLALAQDLLLQVADESFFETEYAGQTRIFCQYCHCEQAFLPPDADLLTSTHEPDCLTRKARQILGETFVEAYHAQVAAERAAADKERAKQMKQQRDAARHKQKQLENDQKQRALSAQKRAQKKLDKHLSAMVGNMQQLERDCKRH